MQHTFCAWLVWCRPCGRTMGGSSSSGKRRRTSSGTWSILCAARCLKMRRTTKSWTTTPRTRRCGRTRPAASSPASSTLRQTARLTTLPCFSRASTGRPSTSKVRRRVGSIDCNFTGTGPDGDTALHLAAVYGQASCVQALLENGADPTVEDHGNALALHDAASGGHLACARLLLSAAPGTVNAVDDDGDTPMHNAARADQPDMVSLLLCRGADAGLCNKAWVGDCSRGGHDTFTAWAASTGPAGG